MFLILIGFVLGCGKEKDAADLLVYNGTIYTVDKDFSTVEAMVIKDGKIFDLGNRNRLEEKYQFDEKYDANDKVIFPGFLDAHAHLYGLGLSLQSVDLVGTSSYEEVLTRVKDFQVKHELDYITGRGWNQNAWKNKEFPTKDKLDSLFPDTPVALTRIDGHALLVNSKALERAGIKAETKVKGGEVLLENGQPSGVLIDNAMELVRITIPKPSREMSARALLEAEEVAVSLGLTTVDDAGLDREIIELIDSLQQVGKMKLRVYAMVSNTPENLDYYLNKGTYKTDRLNLRSFKIYTDGALGSRGAAMRKPYSDRPDHKGLMITPPDSLEYLANRIAKSDFQMNSHAIGDSATIAVLRSYQKALKRQKDRRWRVEHAQIISPEGFDYFTENHNVLASVQPTHATSDMYWAEDRIGAKRMKGAYAYKSLLDKSGVLPLGTDFPVEQVNPMYTFYATVVRKDLDHWPEDGFQMKDALSREEALRGMTIWAAYANFEEEEKGSLTVGKLADFTVLDKDIMKVEEQELPNTEVIATFIGGEQVYEKE